jgi:nucleoside-diphosphate-sugar epimerase
MKVLVAGATGAVGRQLMPLLASAGHEVTGFSRSAGRGNATVGDDSRVADVRILRVDALDRAAVIDTVRQLTPDAVVNMLTAIPARMNTRRLAAELAATNRLRTEGTRNLMDAAAQAGVTRVVAEGLAYAYDPDGEGPANEDEPLWRRPPRDFVPALRALQELEGATRAAGGLVLRLGHLYGPGTIYAADGSFTADVRAGKMPLVGAGRSVFSFTHVQDVATAVLAALDKDVSGVLNVVDDDPAPIREWLPELARLLDARAPRRIPTVLARAVAGGWGVAFMTRLRGADNARARLALDWRPRYPSWREGFADGLGVPATRRPVRDQQR